MAFWFILAVLSALSGARLLTALFVLFALLRMRRK